MKFMASETSDYLSAGRINSTDYLYTRGSLSFLAKKVKEDLLFDINRRLVAVGKLTDEEIKGLFNGL